MSRDNQNGMGLPYIGKPGVSERRQQCRSVVFGRREEDRHGKSETELRKLEMLSVSMGEEIHRLMIDPAIVEIMLNPDGKLWAESLSERASQLLKVPLLQAR